MLSDWGIFSRLLVAALLGSAIGFEGYRSLWVGTLRIHMVVCVGACLLMIVSEFGFAGAMVDQRIVVDPSRLAGQVVSGMGFVGAGYIVARGKIGRGLKIAASLFLAAAIGLAVGGGLLFAATATTAIVVAILTGTRPFERMFNPPRQSFLLEFSAKKGVISSDDALHTLRIETGQLKQFTKSPSEDGIDAIAVRISRISSRDMMALAERLRDIDGVEDVKATILDGSDKSAD